MKTTTQTEFRDHMNEFFNDVQHSSEPLIVTRARKKDIVIMSRKEFESREETSYLQSTPANRKRLSASIREMKKGKTRIITLDDL